MLCEAVEWGETVRFTRRKPKERKSHSMWSSEIKKLLRKVGLC